MSPPALVPDLVRLMRGSLEGLVLAAGAGGPAQQELEAFSVRKEATNGTGMSAVWRQGWHGITHVQVSSVWSGDVPQVLEFWVRIQVPLLWSGTPWQGQDLTRPHRSSLE